MQIFYDCSTYQQCCCSVLGPVYLWQLQNEGMKLNKLSDVLVRAYVMIMVIRNIVNKQTLAIHELKDFHDFVVYDCHTLRNGIFSNSFCFSITTTKEDYTFSNPVMFVLLLLCHSKEAKDALDSVIVQVFSPTCDANHRYIYCTSVHVSAVLSCRGSRRKKNV